MNIEKIIEITGKIKALTPDEFDSFTAAGDLEAHTRERFKDNAESYHEFSSVDEGDTIDDVDEFAMDIFGISMTSCKTLEELCISISELDTEDFTEVMNNLKVLVSNTNN